MLWVWCTSLKDAWRITANRNESHVYGHLSQHICKKCIGWMDLLIECVSIVEYSVLCFIDLFAILLLARTQMTIKTDVEWKCFFLAVSPIFRAMKCTQPSIYFIAFNRRTYNAYGKNRFCRKQRDCMVSDFIFIILMDTNDVSTASIRWRTKVSMCT